MPVDPCPQCGSRLRWLAEATLAERPGDYTPPVAILAICYGCGDQVDGTTTAIDDHGREIPISADQEGEAAAAIAERWEQHHPRMVWLRRCRDLASLRWSATANLRYLQLARKLELSRRHAVELLRVERDLDRVTFSSAHVELLAMLRADVLQQGEGMRRSVRISRAAAGRCVGLQVDAKGPLGSHLDEAIRNAAGIDGFFEEYGATA